MMSLPDEWGWVGRGMRHLLPSGEAGGSLSMEEDKIADLWQEGP